MDELGRREWVGLGALFVALLVALSFFNPAAGRPNVQRPISHGQPVPPREEPESPTPIRTTELPPPRGWTIRYLSGEPGAGTEYGADQLAALDIETDGAPLPTLTDNAWHLYAEAQFELPPGRYGFTLERDCEVVVFVNGAEIRREPDVDVRNFLRVVFEHDGGPATVGITAIDREGSFVLRWAER